jgi:hypothetical protein
MVRTIAAAKCSGRLGNYSEPSDRLATSERLGSERLRAAECGGMSIIFDDREVMKGNEGNAVRVKKL